MRDRRRNKPDVSITHNENECIAIREGLTNINACNLINSNDTVVITPNLVHEKDASSGTVIGGESLREIIHFVKECNPKKIIIATGSGQKNTIEIMKNVGIEKIINEENILFIDLNNGPFIRMELEHDQPSATNINSIYNEMTFLISFTQLKYHEEATMSGCLKNIALAWPPAIEHGHPKKNLGIHENLHGFIPAILKKFPIDLSILSASPAMIGTGPSKGIPKHTGLLICGTDPVSVDSVGTRMLGFKEQGVNYLYKSIHDKIGIGNIDEINLTGLNITEAEKIFSTAAYGSSIAID